MDHWCAMSLLLKIPFIIFSVIGIHFSYTSPSRPPSSKEVVSPTVFESFIIWLLRLYGTEFAKISVWAVSSAEVASIIIACVDPSQIPESIYDTRFVQFLRTLHSTPITPAFFASSLAVIIGGIFRLYCTSTLGKFWSFELSIRKEHRLVTSGPYSVVRHPSYTAYILQYVGIMVMYGSQGSWMRESGILQVPFVKVPAAICLFLITAGAWASIRRPPVEDKMLQRAFGKEWEEWAKKVKYRLLPGIY